MYIIIYTIYLAIVSTIPLAWSLTYIVSTTLWYGIVCLVHVCQCNDTLIYVKNWQGNDVGTQYRSGIYYYSETQAKLAQESVDAKQKELKNKIVTEVLPAKRFYRAEEYHQQYLEKGGGHGLKQSAAKGCNDPIRCYGWCNGFHLFRFSFGFMICAWVWRINWNDVMRFSYCVVSWELDMDFMV